MSRWRQFFFISAGGVSIWIATILMFNDRCDFRFSGVIQSEYRAGTFTEDSVVGSILELLDYMPDSFALYFTSRSTRL
jgi:hypothetical protein